MTFPVILRSFVTISNILVTDIIVIVIIVLIRQILEFSVYSIETEKTTKEINKKFSKSSYLGDE